MRMMVKLKSEADCEYKNNYHHKLRGRIWRGLKGTDYEELHGDSNSIGFNYSNIFPWGTIEKGDIRKFILSYHDVDLLKVLSEEFGEENDFNVGDMPFEYVDSTIFDVDVGEPGTSGELETATGIYVPVKEKEWSEKIDEDYDDTISWDPENFSYDMFIDKIYSNLDWKHSRIFYDYLPNPSDLSYNIFDEAKLLKSYSLKINVSSDYVRTFVLSKWKFKYNVRDKHHRRILNMVLDTGLGWKNQLGLGFVNKRGDRNE